MLLCILPLALIVDSKYFDSVSHQSVEEQRQKPMKQVADGQNAKERLAPITA